MKQLRYLENLSLYKITQTKQSNGEVLETKVLVSNYDVQVEQISDDVSTSIYGANINNMLRVSSVHSELEDYLAGKIDFTNDNITMYRILIRNRIYKISAVRENWVDILLLSGND